MSASRGAYRHCGYCGHPFPDLEASFPRDCVYCERTTYLNPRPVGVVLQPVGKGVLVIRRALKEGKGKLALPGGYIDIGESWQEGIARELREETAVEVDPAGLKLMDLHSTPQGSHILVFALAPPISLADLPPFTPTREVIERLVLQTFQELAFPLHSRMLEQYFSLFAPPQ